MKGRLQTIPSGAPPRDTRTRAARTFSDIVSFNSTLDQTPSFSSAALAYSPAGTPRTSPVAMRPLPASDARSNPGANRCGLRLGFWLLGFLPLVRPHGRFRLFVSYGGSSSVTKEYRRAVPRLSAGSLVRKCRLAQYDRNHVPLSRNNGSSRRRWRTIPWRSRSAAPASGRRPCGGPEPFC
jgi:hypothetical protein